MRDNRYFCFFSTPIHLDEAEQTLGIKGDILELPKVSFKRILLLKLQTIFCLACWLPWLGLHSNGQNFLFSILTFTYSHLYYQLLVIQMNRLFEEQPCLNGDSRFSVCTFEFGYPSLAVRKIASKYNFRTVFVQHGLLDQFLTPVPFDEMHLWGKWDADFLQNFFSITSIVIHFKFEEAAILRPPALFGNVILFSLEYPTQLLSLHSMQKWIQDSSKLAKVYGMRLILRFHPRTSPSDRMRFIKGVETFEVDQYGGRQIEESLALNRVTICLGFNSSSMLKARVSGTHCLFIQNSMTRFLVGPFDSYPDLFVRIVSLEDLRSWLDRYSSSQKLHFADSVF